MGACCSCCEDASAVVSETEMKEQKATNEKSLSISRVMSAPSVDVQDDCKMSGYGLGLVGVAVEQDAAYWEAHIYHDPGMSQEVSFGVATKKDQQFYRAMEEQDSADAKGTSLMRSIKVKNGDVVGIAVQQSDLPMVQFVLNGEPLHDLAVNRFRGAVYPAIYLPENDGLSVRFVFRESEFQKMSPRREVRAPYCGSRDYMIRLPCCHSARPHIVNRSNKCLIYLNAISVNLVCHL